MYRDKQRYGQDPGRVVRASPHTFTAPVRWAPDRVFTCSWSDFFIAQADAWRPEAWEMIRQTPRPTYLILTKRPERIAMHLPEGWPWPRVGVGGSIESRAYRWRMDVLRTIPAARRFRSIEPLLEELGMLDLCGIGLGTVGGEFGPRARPMDANWVRSIRDQCVAAGVPFFFKQWGGSSRGKGGHELDGRLWNERPC